MSSNKFRLVLNGETKFQSYDPKRYSRSECIHAKMNRREHQLWLNEICCNCHQRKGIHNGYGCPSYQILIK